MSSVTQHPSPNPGLNLLFFSIPESCLLQLAIVPMLLLLVVDKATAQAIQGIGEASEEVFRADRLPILNFPDQQE
jgi:hypothetical protein